MHDLRAELVLIFHSRKLVLDVFDACHLCHDFTFRGHGEVP
jgi:hypothetical protein